MRQARHEERLSLRLSRELFDALETERQRMTRAAGAEVQTTAVVRAILERALFSSRKTRATKEARS